MSLDRFDRYASHLSSNPRAARGFVVYTTNSFRGPDGTRAGYIGGLADRIRGVITAFLIAVATDRIFVLDWRRPLPLKPALRPARWNWEPETWRHVMGLPDEILLLHMIGRSPELDDHDAASLEARLLRGVRVVQFNLNGFSWGLAARLFPESSPAVTFQRAFDTLFQFHLPARFAALWSAVAAVRESGAPLVGVHLRTGAGNGWEDPELNDWNRYEGILRSAFTEAAKRGHSGAAYYFATDSARAKAAVKAADWGRTVLCSDFSIGHVDRSTGMDREAFDHAIVEFMVLRSCDLVVGGAGGFWSAAALSGGREAVSYE